MNFRCTSLLALTLLLAVGCVTPPPNAITSFLDVAQAFERGWDGGGAEDLGRARGLVEAHLAESPDDVEALILSARLVHVEYSNKGFVSSAGGSFPDVEAEIVPRMKGLEHALELQPDNAEAHYWKARVYGISVPAIQDDRFAMVPVNHDVATASARRAVDLEPNNIAYREALATYLLVAQRDNEAAEVLRTVDGGGHPIYRLLVDLKAIPVPPNALFSHAESITFSEQQLARGRIRDYEHVRVRAYIVPGSISELEDFYDDFWPGFKFYRKNVLLRWDAAKLIKLSDSEFQRVVEEEDSLNGYVRLGVLELSPEMLVETSAGFHPPKDLSSGTFLFVVNHRNVD